MLFLDGLAERGGLGDVGLSFAHSSLIVRSSFAERLNRKIFCFDIDEKYVRLICFLPLFVLS